MSGNRKIRPKLPQKTSMSRMYLPKYARRENGGNSQSFGTISSTGANSNKDDSDFDQTINRLRGFMTNFEDEDEITENQFNSDIHESRNGAMSTSKILVPADFLNIPPPAHPPPLNRSSAVPPPIPDPPSRQPPMLPNCVHPSTESFYDPEIEYEQAKLRAIRGQKLRHKKKRRNGETQGRDSRSSNGRRSQNGEVDFRLIPEIHSLNDSDEQQTNALLRLTPHSSGVACPNLGNVPRHHINHLYSPGSNQGSPIYDTYENSILERNESGSFYVPSFGLNSTALSPACRKFDMDRQNNHNYTLLPTAKTTVPMSVSPIKPHYAKTNVASTTCKLKSFYCSWKFVSFALAAGLLFSFAVICYFLASIIMPVNRGFKPIPNLNTVGAEISYLDDLQQNFLRPLPEIFPLGDQIVADLNPKTFGVGSFSVQRSSFVQFNWTVESQAKLAVHGRQTVPPSLTESDFVEIIVGSKLHASPRKRSSGYYESVEPTTYFQNRRTTTFTRYLHEGLWYISIYNDAEAVTTVRFSAYLTDDQVLECKYNCHEKGVCTNGKCSCFRGYAGSYCEETVCPVLCSGNGIFTTGKCHCHKGWKGVDCQVPSNMCEVPHCHRQGFCGSDGECVCNKGFGGKFCEEIGCEDSSCYGHGICMKGKCFCDFGFYGPSCQQTYTQQMVNGQLCPAMLNADQLNTEKCSGHGSYNPVKKVCSCMFGFTGDRCQNSMCNLDCGSHGTCENDHCVCQNGWTDKQCDRISCNQGCQDHGFCEFNGTCRCKQGWNGESCLLNGCGENCGGKGQCRQNSSDWKCFCDPGYKGIHCEILTETHCSDKIDNDEDLLTDCEDSDCCSDPSCIGSNFCETVPEPHQILIRQQAPPPHASFFQKVKFLIDSESLQLYSDSTLFDERRVSVIRGRVVNSRDGTPVTGVRVTDSANPLYGFTISRANGWFDLLTNGGGSVTLQFMRLPFITASSTYAVLWNEILRVDDVVLSTNRQQTKVYAEDESLRKYCDKLESVHSVNPTLLSTWISAGLGSGPTTSDPPSSSLFVEPQSLHVSLPIEGLGTHKANLFYASSSQPGYKSTLYVNMLPGPFHATLRLVHLRIDVEGVRFERNFEPKANLTFIYGWNKRNAYKQKVYGLTKATVTVGFVYKNCTRRPVWVRRQKDLDGFRPVGDDLAGWNLNIRHKLDVTNGVLEKGDGSVIYMKKQALMMSLIFDGKSYVDQMGQNEGTTPDEGLLRPVALSMAKDGSLYVGTHSAIFRRAPKNGPFVQLVKLNPSDSAHKFYIATHPASSVAYVSLPMRRQILKLAHNASQPSFQNPQPQAISSTFVVVAGSGKVCMFNENQCGDGGPAKSASLNFPKGLAFDSQGNLYFADERKIRKVSVDGLITTLIGSNLNAPFQSSNQNFRPAPCQRLLAVEQLTLQWPTSLTCDLFDDHCFFVDGDAVVYEIYVKQQPISVRLAAGLLPHCASILDDERPVRPAPLGHVTSLDTTIDGRLIIGELDNAHARLQVVDPTTGRYSHVGGVHQSQDMHSHNDQSSLDSAHLAKATPLKGPIEVVTDFSGGFTVLDIGSGKIWSMEPQKPSYDSSCRCYRVTDADLNQIFIFNWRGQHLSTKNLLTDMFLHNLTYSSTSSYGILSQVVFEDYQTLKIDRSDMAKSVISLVVNNVQKTTLLIDRFNNMLGEHWVSYGGSTVVKYDSESSGLLVAKTDSQGRVLYRYDTNGRISSATYPSGEFYEFSQGTNDKNQGVEIMRNGLPYAIALTGIQITEISTRCENLSIFESQDRTLIQKDFGKSVVELQYDWETHPLIESHQTSIFRRKIGVNSNFDSGGLSNVLEWRIASTNQKKSAQVNGVSVVNFLHDRKLNKDIFSDSTNQILLEIHYSKMGQPIFWNPAKMQSLAPMNVTFDAHGRTTSLRWGSLSEAFTYDKFGRVSEAKLHTMESHKKILMDYSEDRFMPKSVTSPSGRQYKVTYSRKSGLFESFTAPSSSFHKFFEFPTINGLVYAYTTNTSGISVAYFLSTNFDRKLTSVTYPSNSKVAKFEYNAIGRLTKIFMKNSPYSAIFSYDQDDTRHSVVLNYGTTLILNRTAVRRAFLTVHAEDRRQFSNRQNPSISGNVEMTFSYEYDTQFRVKKLRTNADGVTLQPIEFDYNLLNGRISRFWNYKCEYWDGKSKFYNDHSSFETSYSPIGQPAFNKLVIKNRPIIERRMFYDAQSRLVGSNVKFFIADQSSHSKSYDYDDEGQLVNSVYRLGSDDISWFQYFYDQDSNLIRMSINTTQGYPYPNESLSAYLYDTDGFLSGRGQHVRFEYDSLGRLSKAWSKSMENQYFYNEKDSVIAWNRSSHGMYHFWYGLIDRPNLITHARYPDGTLVTFYYNPESDSLVGMEKGGAFYIISTNHQSTPEMIFSMDGSLLAHMHFSPTGAQVMKSNDFGLLPIGFQGHFHDADFHVVVMPRGRPYDALSGRYMSVDIRQIFDQINLLNPAQSINHRLFNGNNPLNHISHEKLPKSAKNWLFFTGIDLYSMLLTHVNDPSLCSDWSIIKFSSECALGERSANFEIITSHTDHVNNFFDRWKINRFGSTSLHHAILQFKNNSQIETCADFDVENFDEQLSILLNNSHFLSSSVLESKWTIFLWKSLDRFQHDFNKLGFNPDTSLLANQLPALTANHIARNWTISNLDKGQGKNIRIWNQITSINIKYSENLKQELARMPPN